MQVVWCVATFNRKKAHLVTGWMWWVTCSIWTSVEVGSVHRRWRPDEEGHMHVCIPEYRVTPHACVHTWVQGDPACMHACVPAYRVALHETKRLSRQWDIAKSTVSVPMTGCRRGLGRLSTAEVRVWEGERRESWGESELEEEFTPANSAYLEVRRSDAWVKVGGVASQRNERLHKAKYYQEQVICTIVIPGVPAFPRAQ